MTPAPSMIVATVDRLDGTRVQDAVLRVRHIVRLTCGCLRYECDRPGGGYVHVLRGEHCEQFARPSPPAAVPESVPA